MRPDGSGALGSAPTTGDRAAVVARLKNQERHYRERTSDVDLERDAPGPEESAQADFASVAAVSTAGDVGATRFGSWAVGPAPMGPWLISSARHEESAARSHSLCGSVAARGRLARCGQIDALRPPLRKCHAMV